MLNKNDLKVKCFEMPLDQLHLHWYQMQKNDSKQKQIYKCQNTCILLMNSTIWQTIDPLADALPL